MTEEPDWRPVVLATWAEGQRLGAVGPGPLETHLDLAEGLVRGIPAPARWVDLGTGAGIPGLVLAAHWPDAAALLVDAAARRVAVVERAVVELGWHERVEVRHARAEELGRDPTWRETADLVVARSFGPPAVVAECAAPLLAEGGRLIVSEPPDGTATEGRWPAAPLAELGLTREPDDGESPRRCVLRRTGPVPESVPRRPGMPAKRPRF